MSYYIRQLCLTFLGVSLLFFGVARSGFAEANISRARPVNKQSSNIVAPKPNAYKTSNKVDYSYGESLAWKSSPALISDLSHASPAVRSTAAFYLGTRGRQAAPAEKELSRVALHDQSKWARRSAVKALAKIDTPLGWKTIELALRDSDPWVVHSAQRALNGGGRLFSGRLSTPNKSERSTETLSFQIKGDKVIKTEMPLADKSANQ